MTHQRCDSLEPEKHEGKVLLVRILSLGRKSAWTHNGAKRNGTFCGTPAWAQVFNLLHGVMFRRLSGMSGGDAKARTVIDGAN